MSNSSKLRASSAAALVKLAPAPNVIAEKAVKTPETFVDQALVTSFITAQDNVSETALMLFRACALHRVSVAQFGERSDAKIRASEFNCAFAVAKRIGAKGAVAVIDKAAKLAGHKRENVLAALRSARVVTAELKGSALKGAALTKEINQRADAAAEQQSAKNAAKKAASRSVRSVAGPKPGTLDALMPVAMMALIDLQKQLGKVSVSPRMLRKVEDFSKSLAETIELGGAVIDA